MSSKLYVSLVNPDQLPQNIENEAHLEPNGYLLAYCDHKSARYLWTDRDDNVLFDDIAKNSKFTPPKSGTYKVYLEDLKSHKVIEVKIKEDELKFESALTEDSVFDDSNSTVKSDILKNVPVIPLLGLGILKEEMKVELKTENLQLSISVYVNKSLVRSELEIVYHVNSTDEIKIVPKAINGSGIYTYSWNFNDDDMIEYSSIDGILKPKAKSAHYQCMVHDGKNKVSQNIDFFCKLSAKFVWNKEIIPMKIENNIYEFSEPNCDIDFTAQIIGGSGYYDYTWVTDSLNPGSIDTLGFSSDENACGSYKVIISDILETNKAELNLIISKEKKLDPFQVKLIAKSSDKTHDVKDRHIFHTDGKHLIDFHIKPIGDIGAYNVIWFNVDEDQEIKTIDQNNIVLSNYGTYYVIAKSGNDSQTIGFSIEVPPKVTAIFKYTTKNLEQLYEPNSHIVTERKDSANLSVEIKGLEHKCDIAWHLPIDKIIMAGHIPILSAGEYKIISYKHRTKQVLYSTSIFVDFMQKKSPIQLYVNEQLATSEEKIHVGSDRVNLVGLINIVGAGNIGLQYVLLINGQPVKTNTFYTADSKASLYLGIYKLVCLSTVKPAKKSFFSSLCCGSTQAKLIKSFYLSDIELIIRDLNGKTIDKCSITVKYLPNKSKDENSPIKLPSNIRASGDQDKNQSIKSATRQINMYQTSKSG